MTPDTPNEERPNEAGKSLKESSKELSALRALARKLARDSAVSATIEAGPQRVDVYEAAIIEGMKAALERAKAIGGEWKPGGQCEHNDDPCCHVRTASRYQEYIDEETNSLRSGEALK